MLHYLKTNKAEQQQIKALILCLWLFLGNQIAASFYRIHPSFQLQGLWQTSFEETTAFVISTDLSRLWAAACPRPLGSCLHSQLHYSCLLKLCNTCLYMTSYVKYFTAPGVCLVRSLFWRFFTKSTYNGSYPQVYTTDLQQAIQPGLTLFQIVAVAFQECRNQLQSESVSEETHAIYLWEQPCERSSSKENWLARGKRSGTSNSKILQAAQTLIIL